MSETCAQAMSRITREHLSENNGLALGQCLTAVGWVGGTVPEMTEAEGLVELSMADVAGGGIAVGLALAGRRPIYIVRYQGFQWYNCPTILNYAAKSKELWGIPCPVFVRSIAMEGGIGPVASNSHHGLYYRMPGVRICAPMTPKEYQAAWDDFMSHDDPLYVSEHRRSFALSGEMEDLLRDDADVTILAISATRLNAIEAVKLLDAEGIACNLVHLPWLKPFRASAAAMESLRRSRFGGLVLDGDYAAAVAKPIAFDLMHETGSPVHALALEDRVAGFAPHLDNLPPSPARIVARVKEIAGRA